MNRMLIILVMAGAAVAPAAAQELHFLRRTAGYGAIGFGGGNFELGCASGCPGELSAAAFNFELGRHVSPRVRIDLGVALQRNSGYQSRLTTASGGATLYLVGALHVRGAATYVLAQSDSVSVIDHRGGPGYLVGAAYDLHLSRTIALTPYVSLASATVKPVAAGGSDVTARSLNFGANLSSLRGRWECITAAGERIRVTRSNRVRALACLNEVQRRLGTQRGGPKL